MSPDNDIFPISRIRPADDMGSSINITGNNVSGQTLTATLTDGNYIAGGEIVKFTWTKTKDNETSVVSVNDITIQDTSSNNVADNYTIPDNQDAVGSQIRVKVSYRDMGGNVYNDQNIVQSELTDPIKLKNYDGQIEFTENSSYVYENSQRNEIRVRLTDVNKILGVTTVTFKWYRSDNSDVSIQTNTLSPAAGDGARFNELYDSIDSSRLLTEDDIGKTFTVTASYEDADGYENNVVSEISQEIKRKITITTTQTNTINSINPTPTFIFESNSTGNNK